MKFLYKYPQARVPLRAAGRGEPPPRRRSDLEFELLDTGIFDEDRYFDIVIEYAKVDAGRHRASASRRSTAARSRRRCTSCRTSGSATPGRWGPTPRPEPKIAPRAGRAELPQPGHRRLRGRDPAHDPGPLPARPADALRPARRHAAVHRQRDEHAARLRPGRINRTPYVKDAFHRHIIHGEACINPAQIGTKAAIHYRFDAVPPGGSVVLRLRL